MNATLEEYGHMTWTMDETRARVRKSLRDTFPGLFGDVWEAAGESFYRHFKAIHLAELVVANGAETLLKRVHAASVPMAVVSNKRGEHLRHEATHLGWTEYFHELVGANDADRDKPAIDPVLMALSPMGLQPSKGIWFVGDADIDLTCARDAGLTGILVRAEAPTNGEFDGHTPDRYCPNLLALLSAFDGD